MRLSFSQWETYAQCPRKWQHQVLDKLPRSAPGPAAARGIAFHNAIEQHIMSPDGLTTAMPVNHYTEVLDEWREKGGGGKYGELRLGFDPEWYPCPPRGPDCRWVMVLDALHVDTVDGQLLADVGEWKTGKPKDSHKDQRHLYILGAFRKFGVSHARATTYYFDNTEIPQRTNAKESAIPKMIKVWDDRAYQMMNDDFRPPRPGYHCTWCDYAADKGGPCIFSGAKAPAPKLEGKFTSKVVKNVKPLTGLKPTE